MPGAADTFQGMAGPSQGPFSEYLRIQPQRAIDQPTAPPSGWESAPVAAGGVALDFLKGIRQNRLAAAAEQDRNFDTQLQNYQQEVVQAANDPRLTAAGRQAILDTGHQTMTDYGNYVLKDVKPEHGAAHVFKTIFEGMTGGPTKQRGITKQGQAVDWNAEIGKVRNILSDPQNRQDAIFSQAVQERQQVLDQPKRTNLNPSSEQVQQALLPTYYKVLQWAPQYAEKFGQSMGTGYQPAGSREYMMSQLTQAETPATAPPPVPPPASNYTSAAGYTPAQTAADVHPVDTNAGPTYRVPLGTPQRFALLSGMARGQNAPIVMTQPETYITKDGKIFTGRSVGGSPLPQDNGTWDESTGMKVNEPAIRHSLTQGQYYTQAGTDILYKPDPFTGQLVPALDENGKPFRRGYMPIGTFDPTTDTYGFSQRSDLQGKLPAAVGLTREREAGTDRRQDKSIAASGARQATSLAASGSRQATGISARRTNERAQLNLSFDRRIDGILRSARGALSANSLPGAPPPTPEQVARAEQSVKPRVDAINAERAKSLAQFDAGAPAATTPATAPPPPVAAAPGGRKVMKLGDAPE